MQIFDRCHSHVE